MRKDISHADWMDFYKMWDTKTMFSEHDCTHNYEKNAYENKVHVLHYSERGLWCVGCYWMAWLLIEWLDFVKELIEGVAK